MSTHQYINMPGKIYLIYISFWLEIDLPACHEDLAGLETFPEPNAKFKVVQVQHTRENLMWLDFDQGMGSSSLCFTDFQQQPAFFLNALYNYLFRFQPAQLILLTTFVPVFTTRVLGYLYISTTTLLVFKQSL